MKYLLLIILALIPQTITVRITGLKECEPNMRYTSTEVDFKEYVKGVLPNEWMNGWPTESLRAGAIAVKMYAISVYNQQGYLWDCNWNQVYNPSWRNYRTDKAVDDTWNWWLYNTDVVKYEELYNIYIVRTYYNAYWGGCLEQDPGCMPQWESKEDAETMTWQEIILKYYKGNLIELPLFPYSFYWD